MKMVSRLVLVVVCAGLPVVAGGCGGSAGGSSHAASVQHTVPARAAGTSQAAAGAVTQASSATPLPPGMVALVGTHAVTRAMLAQWMAEQIGEDYFLASGGRVPARLVSEPADYPACIALLAAAGRAAGVTGGQLRETCEKLYRAIRLQALEYLVSSYWAVDFGAAHGVTVSATEVARGLGQFKAARYPKQGELQGVLESRTRTLAQELFIFKNDLVSRKLLPKLTAGGTSGALAKEAVSDAETATCPREYVVEHCKGYSTSPATPVHPSAAVMLEEIARWRAQAPH
jgi:hypothetical protein